MTKRTVPKVSGLVRVGTLVETREDVAGLPDFGAANAEATAVTPDASRPLVCSGSGARWR